MKTRIKNLFLNNIGLKLLAILFAIGLWFVVVNVNDPTQTKTFTTTIQIVNQETILEQGKYYEITSGNSVTFRATGKRSVLEKMSGEDFSAVVDMNYIEDGTRVPITITATKNENSVELPSKNYYMDVIIGKAKSNQFTIVAKTSGTLADGYGVEEVKSDVKTVTVYGPEDVISSIAAAEAVLPVDGANRDVTGDVAITLVDGSGNQVDTSKLDLSREKVTVTAKVCMVKNVPIKVETSGTLPSGLTLGSITTSPSSVTIKGESRDINKVTEITIPGSVFNLNNVTGNVETVVDINQYLPANVTVLNASDATVTVKITVNSKTTKSYKVSTNNLTINNLPTGLTAEFSDSYVNVDITALPDQLKELDESKITGSVDASGLSKGTHSVNVVLTLDSEYQAKTTTTKIVVE